MQLNRPGLELGQYLSYLSARQEVIASNIANADTPGYKTLDLEPPGDFLSSLVSVAAVVEAPGLVTHNDGNNVSIDREARLLAENAMRFNIAAQVVRSQLRMLRSAIEEGHSA